MIKHHVKEEEQRGGMFAQAKDDGDVDLVALGAAMRARKKELAARMKSAGVPTPATRSMKGAALRTCGAGGVAASAFRLPDSEVFHGPHDIQEADHEVGEPDEHASRRAEKPISRSLTARPATAYLTTNHGTRISDNQNSLRLGAGGPTLLEDFILREKIFHFDHERIPERIVHARGSGAHGYFECTRAIPELTRATVFAKKGKRTPVFCRFSTVAGSKGSKDTPRDVRGFAVKFYSDEGNWDLVGNNIPVFFIQDAIKFPDLIHAVKPEADRGFPQAASAHDTFWDFVSLMPESMHMIMWAMSDRALPRSLRMMEGFGVHTFRFVNAAGESRFVKFHWRPRLGMQSTLWDEAVKISGADPDYHRRDLWEAITSGNPPEWDLGVQVFDEAFADAQPYDVLDATKLIPEEDVPLTIVGRLVLDRWPDNFFAETEQVAFLPSNVIPGIDFSDDPLLQGRLFSYLDTQKSRLGTANFHQIPVNAPKCPFQNFQRDGMMQTQVFKGRANYEPNSLGEAGEDGGPRESPQAGFVSAGRVALGERSGAEVADSRGAVRRSLQPGAPLLSFADADRAGAHRIGAGVRAVQGRARARSQARRSPTCATSTRTSRAASPTARDAAAARIDAGSRADRHGSVARRCRSSAR